MYCSNCGSQVNEDNEFCSCCGTRVSGSTATQPIQNIPVMTNQVISKITPLAESLANSCLVYGILSAAFAFAWYFSFLGIIFGCIGLKKAKKFTKETNLLYGKAKVGKWISFGGLITSAIFTTIMLMYTILWLCMVGISIAAAVAESY